MAVILTYHGIGEEDSPLFTSVARFESHLQMFAEAGWESTTVLSLVKRIISNEEIPQKSVTFTFDDVFANVFTEAWPRLKHWGFGASLFPVTAYIGKTNLWPGQNGTAPSIELMDWGQIKEMASGGAEIGAHTHTHPPLTRLSTPKIKQEFTLSNENFQQSTGRKPVIVSYPYGVSNDRVRQSARNFYTAAVGTRLGFVTSSSDLFQLPRVDAYYLSEYWLERILDFRFPIYLEIRNWMRMLRRKLRPDWKGGVF